MPQTSTFECQTCGDVFLGELPAWDHYEALPNCCGDIAFLLEPSLAAQVGTTGEGRIKSPAADHDDGLPLPGSDDPTAIV